MTLGPTPNLPSGSLSLLSAAREPHISAMALFMPSLKLADTLALNHLMTDNMGGSNKEGVTVILSPVEFKCQSP